MTQYNTDRDLDAAIAVLVMGMAHVAIYHRVLHSWGGGSYETWRAPWQYESGQWRPEQDQSLGQEELCYWGIGEVLPVLPYSTDIESAWKVIGQLRSQGYILGLYSPGYPTSTTREWTCYFEQDDTAGTATADTAPRAICRAALDAVTSRAPGL